MYSVKELKEIYEKRYENTSESKNEKEINLYNKFRKILLPKSFLKKKIVHLDLGCGKGNKITGFVSGFKKTKAIDISENVIKLCKKNHQYSSIDFEVADALKIEGKFNLITAFGFSLFNTSDSYLFLETLNGFIERNVDNTDESYIIIRSHTDFSGEGKESWYLHTREDLDFLVSEISKKGEVNIIFPHKQLNNYLGHGVYNLFAELYRLLKKKKTFFIVIRYGQK